MSRDMQIGLLLAVGFLALVGGVLFYRIEHPDELEQFLGGNQALATAPAGKEAENAPGTLTFDSSTNNLPPAPGHTAAPPIEAYVPALTNNTTGNTGNASGNNVVLASGAGNNATPPAATMPTPPVNSGPPPLDLSLNKSNETPATTAAAPEVKKETTGSTTSRSSLPTEPPANTTTPPTAPNQTAPSLVFDIPKASAPPAETKKPEEKKPEEKKPVDVVVKPEAAAPTAATPPAMTPPAMTPLSTTPPAFTGPTLPTTPTNNLPPAVDTTIKPTTPAPDLNKSQEMPQPPVVTPPAGGTLFENKPNNTSPLTNSAPNSTAGNAAPPATDADGFRTYPPKVGLGKPLAESEASLREKRWAETAGNPSPIIPSSSSSSDTRGAVSSAPSSTQRDRKVVQDTYIPTERAQRGETFSSLSQRLYGDTNYAVALAAFNKEEGFVKMDQPEANEWVAKPNREILDQRFPQLVRRLTPTSINGMKNNVPVGNNASGAATPVAANHPTYRVAKGEQLFEVAKKTLGDGYRWSEIYALNKDLLRESTELRPEMVLKLPVDAKK